MLGDRGRWSWVGVYAVRRGRCERKRLDEASCAWFAGSAYRSITLCSYSWFKLCTTNLCQSKLISEKPDIAIGEGWMFVAWVGCEAVAIFLVYFDVLAAPF